ncbi:MAG: signal peptidase I [Bacilli bacterium]|nr:signal peptidase I [Bacilli bacterium]
MRKIIDNKIFKIIYGLFKFVFIAILVIYISFLAIQKFSDSGTIMGYRLYTIATGSMEPELTVGDVILVEETKFEDLKVKDVITYESKVAGMEGMIVTHRIIDMNTETKELITRGDANDADDPLITFDQVQGKVTYKFMIISLLTKLVRNKVGFYFLVFVPLVLVIFLEIADVVTQPKDEDDEDEKEST